MGIVVSGFAFEGDGGVGIDADDAGWNGDIVIGHVGAAGAFADRIGNVGDEKTVFGFGGEQDFFGGVVDDIGAQDIEHALVGFVGLVEGELGVTVVEEDAVFVFVVVAEGGVGGVATESLLAMGEELGPVAFHEIGLVFLAGEVGGFAESGREDAKLGAEVGFDQVVEVVDGAEGVEGGVDPLIKIILGDFGDAVVQVLAHEFEDFGGEIFVFVIETAGVGGGDAGGDIELEVEQILEEQCVREVISRRACAGPLG